MKLYYYLTVQTDLLIELVYTFESVFQSLIAWYTPFTVLDSAQS